MLAFANQIALKISLRKDLHSLQNLILIVAVLEIKYTNGEGVQ